MLGKCMTQILRMSAVLQALKNCFSITNQLKTVNELIIYSQIESELEILISKASVKVLVSLFCIENAKRLMS